MLPPSGSKKCAAIIPSKDRRAKLHNPPHDVSMAFCRSNTKRLNLARRVDCLKPQGDLDDQYIASRSGFEYNLLINRAGLVDPKHRTPEYVSFWDLH